MPHPIEDDLEVEGSPITQGTAEEVPYIIRWRGASSVSSPAVTVYNGSGDDKTSVVMPSGSPAASGTRVTLPDLKLLDAQDGPYRVVHTATVDGSKQAAVLVVVPRDEALIGANT